jgi:RimJ/RimL family protein N-acetyltransferase
VALYSGVELTDLELSGPRLTLRPWRAEDAPAVYEAMQDRRMHEFLELPDPYTRAAAEQWVTEYAQEGRSNGTALECALVETATGRVIGSADLRLPQPRRVPTAWIGYAVYPAAQGNGYAAEATEVLTGWAFQLGLPRVEIFCAVNNVASVRTALNAGYRFEGVAARLAPTPDGLADAARFARVPGDPVEPVRPVLPPLPPGGLSDGVVALRVVLPEDAPALFDEIASEESRRWLFDDRAPTAEQIARTAARAQLEWLVGPMGRLAIVDVSSGAVAGSLGLRQIGPPQIANVGYGLRPAFRGRAYTARALRLLVSWAFEEAGLARLELGAKVDNIASQKAAAAGGFLPDGIRQARLRNPDGTFSDEVRFALVNPKYATTASAG